MAWILFRDERSGDIKLFPAGVIVEISHTPGKDRLRIAVAIKPILEVYVTDQIYPFDQVGAAVNAAVEMGRAIVDGAKVAAYYESQREDAPKHGDECVSGYCDPDDIPGGRQALAGMAGARRCRVCGCTDDDCSQCIAKTGGPCHWIEGDLCSACLPETRLPETRQLHGFDAQASARGLLAGRHPRAGAVRFYNVNTRKPIWGWEACPQEAPWPPKPGDEFIEGGLTYVVTSWLRPSGSEDYEIMVRRKA